MSHECPNCHGKEFHANQRLYVDVIVDGGNNFLRNIAGTERTGELGVTITEADNPYGPFRCINCGVEYDDLDELVEAEGEPAPGLMEFCTLTVLNLTNGDVRDHDLYVGKSREEVSRWAEGRAANYATENGVANIDNPEVRNAFLNDGFIDSEDGTRRILIMWPDVTETDV